MAITLIGRINEHDVKRKFSDEKEIYFGRNYEDERIRKGLLIPDKNVSRVHCEIVHGEDDDYFVRDLESKNGTYVNGHKVSGEVSLSNGDELGITGKYKFKVKIE